MHRYMYMVNRGSGLPPPPADLWEVVSRGGLDRGRVPSYIQFYSRLDLLTCYEYNFFYIIYSQF